MNSPFRPDPTAIDVRPISPEPARAPSMMRKLEVLTFNRDGEVKSGSHIVPAHPLFEDAASSFVRGTILRTDSGPIAIEDLLPGDRLLDTGGQLAQVLWIGSTMIVPGTAGQRDEMRHTWRITADKFGIGRPMPDLILAQGARLPVERTSLRSMLGVPRAMMPVAELSDDMGLIRLQPPTPVRVYHVMLDRHCLFHAAGLEVESYHPGENVADMASRNMLSLFLSLFPHIHGPDDFGPLGVPRATRAVLEGLSAA